MSYPVEFRRLVMPTLDAECRGQGLLVALDQVAYSEAVGAVMALALRRGAGYLPADLFDGLLDWVCCSIMQVAASHEAQIEEASRLIDRVARQVADVTRVYPW